MRFKYVLIDISSFFSLLVVMSTQYSAHTKKAEFIYNIVCINTKQRKREYSQRQNAALCVDTTGKGKNDFVIWLAKVNSIYNKIK